MTNSEAIETLRANYPDACYGLLRDAVDTAICALSTQPEIIRCKDCKHWKSNEFIGNNDVLTANLHSYPCKYAITDAEWFCGFAERRQDD